MSYTTLPELIAILWMAVVLARLRRGQDDDFLHLWITGLFLFVVEGIARILYLAHLSPGLHATMHVVALDAYFLAGVVFFQSATARLGFMDRNRTALYVSSLPHLILLTMYGSNLHSRSWFLGVAAAGLAVGLGSAAVFRRRYWLWIAHAVIWAPILASAWMGHFRLVAYLSLFFKYLGTAVAFYIALPRERKGRGVVVAGFCLWSLCFLTHPWIAEHRHAWLPMAENIWDLQKFVVMFGLLIVSLEEKSAANEYQALHDTLTGLPNRRLFDDRLEQALARGGRYKSRVVLFNMDLDGFKQVNDTLGHEAGDELLREIGRRLLTVTRETDTLARMGGDEFYLLINDLNIPSGRMAETPARIQDHASRMAEGFRYAVEDQPYVLQVDGETHRLHVQLSIGSVVYPDEARDRTELCRLADQKMYADKKQRSEGSLQLVVGAAMS